MNDSLQHWARINKKAVQYIEKGQNCKTELYSFLEAEVEDPADVSTAFDVTLLNQLKSASKVIICGQASSHCVKFTVEDLLKSWPEENRSKLIILKDGCSPVAGYERAAYQFFQEMEKKGLTITTCSEVFKLIGAQVKTEQQLKDQEQNEKIKKQTERDDRQDRAMAELIELVKQSLSKH